MAFAPMSEIRLFLAAPTTTRPPAGLIRTLEQLAERASRGTGVGRVFDASDVAAELLQRRYEGDMAGTDWTTLDDSAAKGVLLRRLRQLAVERSEGWNGYRALRSLVARAVESGLAESPEPPPSTLYVGDRLCADRVAAAAAWHAHSGGCPRDDINGLTRTMARIYLPSFVAQTEANEDSEPDPEGCRTGFAEAVEDRLDAQRLLRELSQIDAPGLTLVQRRTRGETFTALAREQGVGLATVHGRVASFHTRMTEVVRAKGYSRGAVAACFDALGAP